jgi:hypothetical protein
MIKGMVINPLDVCPHCYSIPVMTNAAQHFLTMGPTVFKKQQCCHIRSVSPDSTLLHRFAWKGLRKSTAIAVDASLLVNNITPVCNADQSAALCTCELPVLR